VLIAPEQLPPTAPSSRLPRRCQPGGRCCTGRWGRFGARRDLTGQHDGEEWQVPLNLHCCLRRCCLQIYHSTLASPPTNQVPPTLPFASLALSPAAALLGGAAVSGPPAGGPKALLSEALNLCLQNQQIGLQPHSACTACVGKRAGSAESAARNGGGRKLSAVRSARLRVRPGSPADVQCRLPSPSP
jgi:hypothetical protein